MKQPYTVLQQEQDGFKKILWMVITWVITKEINIIIRVKDISNQMIQMLDNCFPLLLLDNLNDLKLKQLVTDMHKLQ